MNQMTAPPRLEVIPETAPFSEAQRSWLNGFLVGMLSLDGSVPLSPEAGAAVLQGATGDGDDGEAPWHDQTMPIVDRMKLAKGRPLRRRMMAAMAQQDCGQCGYNCNDYSEAIAGAAKTGAAAVPDEAGDAFSNSSFSALSIRAVSLPPGTHRLSRGSALLTIASE